jgi:hypothetical protein
MSKTLPTRIAEALDRLLATDGCIARGSDGDEEEEEDEEEDNREEEEEEDSEDESDGYSE